MYIQSSSNSITIACCYSRILTTLLLIQPICYVYPEACSQSGGLTKGFKIAKKRKNQDLLLFHFTGIKRFKSEAD